MGQFCLCPFQLELFCESDDFGLNSFLLSQFRLVPGEWRAPVILRRGGWSLGGCEFGTSISFNNPPTWLQFDKGGTRAAGSRPCLPATNLRMKLIYEQAVGLLSAHKKHVLHNQELDATRKCDDFEDLLIEETDMICDDNTTFSPSLVYRWLLYDALPFHNIF